MESPGEEDVDFAPLAEEVRERKPREDPPVLAMVTKHFHRVRGSSLQKTARRTEAFRIVDLDAATDEEIADAAILKWAIWSDFEITPEQRARIPAGRKVVNDTGVSCLKGPVMDAFEEVFGRTIRVDPLTHEGEAIEKSTYNGRHDGQVVRLPMAEVGYDPRPERIKDWPWYPEDQRDANYVYQRAIDNTLDGKWVFDIRLPNFLGSIPFAYVKYRPLGIRFQNTNSHAEIVAPHDVLTRAEIEQCRAFFAAMKLEYGEIDVLRDAGDGLIYVVDANNTPAGPPKGLPGKARREAFGRHADAVRDNFFA